MIRFASVYNHNLLLTGACVSNYWRIVCNILKRETLTWEREMNTSHLHCGILYSG